MRMEVNYSDESNRANDTKRVGQTGDWHWLVNKSKQGENFCARHEGIVELGGKKRQKSESGISPLAPPPPRARRVQITYILRSEPQTRRRVIRTFDRSIRMQDGTAGLNARFVQQNLTGQLFVR